MSLKTLVNDLLRKQDRNVMMSADDGKLTTEIKLVSPEQATRLDKNSSGYLNSMITKATQ